MTRIGPLLTLLALVAPSALWAAGFAHDANFIVMAPNQMVANDVLAAANDLRRQVAIEWLGEELPPSVGRTVISVTFSDFEDSGLTWPVDTPERTLHKVWLRTSPAGAVGSTLAHEIVHVVLATQYAGRLPAWAEEGVASRVDDAQRIAARRRILAWCARTGNWPSLQTLLQMPTISSEDQRAYAAAASVTEYLIARGGKTKFLRFALAGKQNGWDAALRQYYGLPSVADLQAAWQAWASRAATANQLAWRW